jgi:hypothetical protein
MHGSREYPVLTKVCITIYIYALKNYFRSPAKVPRRLDDLDNSVLDGTHLGTLSLT